MCSVAERRASAVSMEGSRSPRKYAGHDNWSWGDRDRGLTGINGGAMPRPVNPGNGYLEQDVEKEPFMSRSASDPALSPRMDKVAWYQESQAWKFAEAYSDGAVNCCDWMIRRKWTLVTLTVLLLVSGFIYVGQNPQALDEEFVRASGTQFEVACRPWYPAGFNAHHLVANVLVNANEHKTPGHKRGRQLIYDAFKIASGMGLNVMRTFAHTTETQFPFQISPGVYNEKVFQGLDIILEEARRFGIRVILSVTDNWKYPGGLDQYVDWSTTTPPRTRQRPPDGDGDAGGVQMDEEQKLYEVSRHALFYTDQGCKDMYKAHLRTLMNRKNTINGRVYKDDPTIFAWDLINEPRCETWQVKECDTYTTEWITEIAKWAKTEDPNHLVTVGGEGFFSADSPRKNINPEMPGSTWACETGQDFTKHMKLDGIDFAGIHVWPDNWKMSQEFQVKWVTEHIDEVEAVIGKPLLMEEFGKIVYEHDYGKGLIEKERNPVYKAMTEVTELSVAKGRALQGALFWRWDVQVYEGVGPGEYGVRPDHTSTFDIIRSFGKNLHHAIVSQAPREECHLECWVPVTKFPSIKTCENAPQVCDDYWARKNKGEEPSHAEVWPSKAACCRPGMGAYPNGCSLLSSFA